MIFETLGDLMEHPAYKAYERARNRMDAWKKLIDMDHRDSMASAFPYAIEGLEIAFSYIESLSAKVDELEQVIADYERQRQIAIGMGWAPATPVVVVQRSESAGGG
jgi:hypothetical protein